MSNIVLNMVEATLLQAIEIWGQYIDAPQANITINLSVQEFGGNTLAAAGPNFVSFGGGEFEDLVNLELAGNTNIDVSSILDSDADVIIDLSSLVTNSFFIDGTTDPSPANLAFNESDLFTVLLHELGHVFGFITDPELNTLFGDFVTDINGEFFFTGPNAVAAFGGNLPLDVATAIVNGANVTFGDAHFGENSVLGGDLLSPALSDGVRLHINPLHIAILEDLGINTVSETAGDDTLFGFELTDDVLTGLNGDDILNGLSGNDSLDGGLGDDTINGGTGFDTAVYTGNIADYDVTTNADGSVTVVNTSAGPANQDTDTLTSVERLQFADGTVDLANPDNEILDDFGDTFATAELINIGDPATAGNLEATGDNDVFAVTLIEGVQYQFSVDLLSLTDSTLELFDSNGISVAFNDDVDFNLVGPSDFSSEIIFTASSTGVFFLDVRSFNNDLTGTYTLAASVFSNDIGDVVGTNQDDTFVIDEGSSGTVDGLAGFDTLIINGPILVSTVIDFSDPLLGSAPSLEAVNDAFTGTDVDLTSIERVIFADIGASNDIDAPDSIIRAIAEVGTAQDDVIDFSAENADVAIFIAGGAGDDIITSSQGSDLLSALSGGDGNDTLNGGSGVNVLFGGAGVDILNGGAEDDILLGGLGADTLNGGGGNDTAEYSESSSGLRASLTTPSGNLGEAIGDVFISIESLAGSEFNDVLVGDGGENTLSGNGGVDNIFGFNGDDILNGGDGNDRLFGGSDNDVLNGDGGNDFLNAGIGNDTIFGGEGVDTLFGAAGNDTLRGGVEVDNLFGGTGNDTLFGDEGNDQLRGQAGDDILNGGDGDDLLSGFIGADTLFGGSGADNLFGGVSDDEINGGAGDDRLFGQEDNDTLNGDDGNDVVVGGIGDDTITGGAGNDILFGSNGVDILNGDAGNDDLSGGGQNDELFGGAGNDVLRGNSGIDVLEGGTGNDLLVGGASADTFVFGFDAGIDRIFDFNVNSDVIQLDDSTTFSSFSDVQAFLTDNVAGNFVTFMISDEASVRIDGVQASDLSASNFTIIQPGGMSVASSVSQAQSVLFEGFDAFETDTIDPLTEAFDETPFISDDNGDVFDISSLEDLGFDDGAFA